MKGTILDYTNTEIFLLLDDDSIVTVPLDSFSNNAPIGSIVNVSSLYNGTYAINYRPQNIYDKTVDFF